MLTVHPNFLKLNPSIYWNKPYIYSQLSQSLFNQSTTINTLTQDFREYSTQLNTMSSEIAEVRTIVKGLETQANMAVAKSSKAEVMISNIQRNLIDRFLIKYQISIPNLNNDSSYTLNLATITLIGAVSLSGKIEAFWNTTQMKMNVMQSEMQQIFENSRRALSYVNNFEKKSLDLKNLFYSGFRGP